MAAGGWIYGGSVMLGPHGNTDAEWQADWRAILALLHSISGWALHQDLTSMVVSGVNNSYYAISKYGGPGDDGYLIWIFSMQSSGTLVHADNYYSNATFNTSTAYQPTIYCAWIPPGVALPGAGDPRTAGWLSSAALRFQSFNTEYDQIYSNGQARIHVTAKGPNVMLMGEDHAQSGDLIDNLLMQGNLIKTLANVSDTSYAIGVSFYPSTNDGISGSTINYQMKSAAGAQFHHGIGMSIPGYPTTTPNITDALVNDRAPFNWVSRTVRMVNANLTTYGVVPGNGAKGIIDPDHWRAIRTGAVNPKQQLEGGTLIHLSNGFVVGWDPSNGAMD